MALDDDLRRIAEVAVGFADAGEDLAAVIPTEPLGGQRIYLCAFTGSDGESWLAFDSEGNPVTDRRVVRNAVSIAAMCELAEESAGGGKLPELRAQLATLRETEQPEGIDEAEEAAERLDQTIGSETRVASPGYLDEVGAAARVLEHALGEHAPSPFAEAMKQAGLTVDGLAADIEGHYKLELA
jgi:hypothetical protein